MLRDLKCVLKLVWIKYLAFNICLTPEDTTLLNFTVFRYRNYGVRVMIGVLYFCIFKCLRPFIANILVFIHYFLFIFHFLTILYSSIGWFIFPYSLYLYPIFKPEFTPLGMGHVIRCFFQIHQSNNKICIVLNCYRHDSSPFQLPLLLRERYWWRCV